MFWVGDILVSDSVNIRQSVSTYLLVRCEKCFRLSPPESPKAIAGPKQWMLHAPVIPLTLKRLRAAAPGPFTQSRDRHEVSWSLGCESRNVVELSANAQFTHSAAECDGDSEFLLRPLVHQSLQQIDSSQRGCDCVPSSQDSGKKFPLIVHGSP